MPERRNAINNLALSLCGSALFDNLYFTVKFGKGNHEKTIERDDYDEIFGGAYDAMIKRVDWNRVLLEATSCHMARQDINPEHKMRFEDYSDEICPDCVMQALLADKTLVDWKTLAKELEP